jgi:phosphomannomutase
MPFHFVIEPLTLRNQIRIKVTLIKSISGIRGTIGGHENEGLTPIDVVKFTSAFCALIQRKNNASKIKVVVGRDARISGNMINALVCNTLVGMQGSF